VTQIHHVGLTVSDLDRSLAFWRDAVGMDVVLEPQERQGGYFEAIVCEPGVHVRMAQLAFPGTATPRVELFQYLAPPAGVHRSRPADVGFAHVCLTCADLDALLGRLREAGGEPFSGVVEVDHGANRGARCLYLRDPDGHVVELIQPAPAAA
jgi:glyoxylase I family protein